MSPGKTTFPPVPEELRSRNPLRYLKFYGPGAIIASVTIGSGETVFASRGGAIFGYALVWCLVLVSALKAIQAYSSMRIITLTGRHPVYYWARMKGPKGWFPLLLGIVALFTMASTFGALSKALATLLMQLAERAPDSPGYETLLHGCASAILVVLGARRARKLVSNAGARPDGDHPALPRVHRRFLRRAAAGSRSARLERVRGFVSELPRLGEGELSGDRRAPALARSHDLHRPHRRQQHGLHGVPEFPSREEVGSRREAHVRRRRRPT